MQNRESCGQKRKEVSVGHLAKLEWKSEGGEIQRADRSPVVSCCRFDGHRVKLIPPCVRTQPADVADGRVTPDRALHDRLRLYETHLISVSIKPAAAQV